jgi:hypothetical protein
MFDKKTVDEFQKIFGKISIIKFDFDCDKDDFIYSRINNSKVRIKCLARVKIGDNCLIFEESNFYYLLNISDHSTSLNYQRNIEFNKQSLNKNNLFLPFKILYTKFNADNARVFIGGHSKTPTFLFATDNFNPEINYLASGNIANKGKNNFLSFSSLPLESSDLYLTSRRKQIYQNKLISNFALNFYWLGYDFFFTYYTIDVYTLIAPNFDESSKLLYLIDKDGNQENIPLIADEIFDENESPRFDRGNLVYNKSTTFFDRHIKFEFEYSGVEFYYEERLARRSESEETTTYNNANNFTRSTRINELSALRSVEFLLPFFCGEDFILYSKYEDAGNIEHQASYSSDSDLISATVFYNDDQLRTSSFTDPSSIGSFVIRGANDIIFRDGQQIEADNFRTDLNYYELIKPYYYDKNEKTTRELDSNFSGCMEVDISIDIEKLPQVNSVYFGNKKDNDGKYYTSDLSTSLPESTIGVDIVYYKKINGQFYEFKGSIIGEQRITQLDDTVVVNDIEFNRYYWQIEIQFELITQLVYFHRDNYLIINPHSINGFCLFLNWANNRSGYIRISHNNYYAYHRYLDYFEVFAHQNNLSSKGNRIYVSHVDINSIKSKNGIGFVYVFEIIEDKIILKEVLVDKIYKLKISDNDNFNDYSISYHPRT